MATTPGRRTRVIIDPPRTISIQPSWQADLKMRGLSQGTEPGTQNVLFWPNIGWKVSEYQATMRVLHEEEDADDAVEVFDTATGAMPGTGWLLTKIQRTPSELVGLGAVTTRDSGDYVYRKSVQAGDSVAVNNSSDQATLPPPSGSTVPLDRVAVGSADHKPDEGLYLRFFVPNTPGSSNGPVVRLYFTGVPTYDILDDAPGRDPGTGRYCLELLGDGYCALQEYDGSAWRIRHRMQWSVPQNVSGRWHSIAINSDARQDEEGNWTGSRILFRFQTSGHSIVATILDIVESIIVPQVSEYLTRQKAPTQPIIGVLRLDVRRDIFCDFQVSRNKYRPTGTIRTITKAIPFEPQNPPSGIAPIYVSINGYFPPGTSVDVEMRCEDAGDVALAAQGTGSSASTYFLKGFAPLPGKRKYYAIITLNASSDRTKTPTVRSVGFYRSPTYKQVISAEELVIMGDDIAPCVLSGVSVLGPSEDPTHESASLVITDYANALERLAKRVDVPIRIDILDPTPEDPGRFSIVFMGRVAKARRETIGGGEDSYPNAYWGRYTLLCVGEWADFSERQASQRWDLNRPDTNYGESPFTVTTALRTYFEDAGIPPTRYYVPSSEPRLRLFASGDVNEKLQIEPYAPLMPLTVDTAREYWGAYVILDANATNGGGEDDVEGCWVVRQPQRPPYRVLANFFFAPTVPGVPAISPGAYADVGGQKSTFVEKGSLTTWVVPPEGNKVRVIGSAPANSRILGSTQGAAYEAILHNWAAADFGQGVSGPHPAPDPTNPDWTNGKPRVIAYTNGALTTQKAVDFAARRIFDRACHARHFKSFQAPLLLVTDSGDPLQIRPRPLRFGDFVYFEGVLHVVNSVGFAYAEGKDEFQMASYEIFSVPALLASGDQPDETYRVIQGRMR